MKRHPVCRWGGWLIVLALCLAPAHAAADSLEWRGYEKGKQEAGDTGKKMLVYFRTSWCGYCDRMEKTTFSDEQVIAYIEEHFVPVKVDADVMKTLARDYMVEGYPTNWFLSPEGEKLRVLGEYVEAGPFLLVLRYIDSNAYLTQSFSEFMKKAN